MKLAIIVYSQIHQPVKASELVIVVRERDLGVVVDIKKLTQFNSSKKDKFLGIGREGAGGKDR